MKMSPTDLENERVETRSVGDRSQITTRDKRNRKMKTYQYIVSVTFSELTPVAIRSIVAADIPDLICLQDYDENIQLITCSEGSLIDEGSPIDE